MPCSASSSRVAKNAAAPICLAMEGTWRPRSSRSVGARDPRSGNETVFRSALPRSRPEGELRVGDRIAVYVDARHPSRHWVATGRAPPMGHRDPMRHPVDRNRSGASPPLVLRSGLFRPSPVF